MRVLARLLRGLDSGVANAQRAILIGISIMVTSTMLTEVLARYVFETPIWGMDEITGHTAVWLYLMGAAYGTYGRGQIKAEFIHLIVKNPRTLCIFRAAAAGIAMVVASFMVAWSIKYVQWSISRHEITPTLMIPTVIFQVPILIGAILMAIYFLVETVDFARQARRHRPASP